MLNPLRTRHHRWRTWHRSIGMVACIGMIMWGLSGALHPLMTRLQPVPQQWAPPLQAVDMRHVMALPTLLQQQGLSHFQHISLAHLDGQAYYRVQTQLTGNARYYAMHTGLPRADAEAVHAKALARYYTGLHHTPIRAVKKINQFDADYPAVNRILPVWRVDFADEHGLRAYVDTEQSRLATLVDHRKAWLTTLFQWGHTWSFLADMGRLQLAVITTMLAGVLASAYTGLALFMQRSRTAKRITRSTLVTWHRNLAMAVLAGLLLLGSSGLYHAWHSDAQRHRPPLPSGGRASALAIRAADWQRVFAEGQPSTLFKLDVYGHQQQIVWQVIAAPVQAMHPSNAMPPALPMAAVGVLHHTSTATTTHRQANPAHTPHAHPPSQGPMPALWLTNHGHTQRVDVGTYGNNWLSQWSLTPSANIQPQWVTQFGDEYGFIFKRLPVIRFTRQDASHTRWYVEPATGAVAAVINDDDAREGWVFATLHKWSVPGLSKTVRDSLAITLAIAVALTGMMGLWLLLRQRSAHPRGE